MDNYLFKDKAGQYCGAKTLYTISSSIVLFKYLVGGLTLFGISFPEFDTAGAAMLVAAFGGIYKMREKDKGL